ncbi:MAG: aminopeptidase P N-terminal domain-containing protein [Terriglobales bacterium]
MRKLLFSFLLLSLSAAALDRQANADYRARRQSLAAKTNGSVVVLFAGTEAERPNALYSFRQDDNFFYLTGWSEPGAALVIAPAGLVSPVAPPRPYIEILFLPARNSTQERWTGPKLGPENDDAPRITGFDRVEPLDKLRDELERLLPKPRATVLSDLPAYGESSPAPGALDWLRRANAFPNYISFQDVKPLLAALRVKKDAGELERIRKATDASIAAHLAAMHAMKPGMSEREISALMQYEFLRRGCERPAYAPIVGAGFNSTVLHYSLDSGPIETGDVVVMDVGGEYSMYATDITRTLPANGKFTARQREIYDIVLGAQQAAIAAFQAGKSTLGRSSPDSLYKVAYDYIDTHGKDRAGRPLGRYFIHGLGHYVGLGVHDVGDTGAPLGPGAVFTIEPGIYIPEERLGVRIEDIFYVDAEGKLINLTEKLPHTAEEVEKEMAGHWAEPRG